MIPTAEVSWPFPTKNGRPVKPHRGEKCYVSSSSEPLRFGGLATVGYYRTDGSIVVEEHPDTYYYWRLLKRQQVALHQQFNGANARMPTEDELLAVASAKIAKAIRQAHASRQDGAR